MKADAPLNRPNGVAICFEAFERLKAGKPLVVAHVGLPPDKITSGIVSFEAGFDRGYLKKSRPAHLALIAQIEAFRRNPQSAGASKANEVKRAKNKAAQAESELDQAHNQLYLVLTQNLQLVERVRDLEGQLAKSRGRGKVVKL